jgi:hypothetical protein
MKKKEGKEKVAIMGEADWGKDGRLRARIKLFSFAHEGGGVTGSHPNTYYLRRA